MIQILSLATLISWSLDPLPLIVPSHKLQDLCFKFMLQILAYLTLPAFSDSPNLPDENQMTVEGIEPSLVYPWYTCAPYTYCLRNHRPMCYHRLHSMTPCTLVAIVWLTLTNHPPDHLPSSSSYTSAYRRRNWYAYTIDGYIWLVAQLLEQWRMPDSNRAPTPWKGVVVTTRLIRLNHVQLLVLNLSGI